MNANIPVPGYNQAGREMKRIGGRGWGGWKVVAMYTVI